MSDIAYKLRELRKQRGLTLRDVGKKAGLAPSYLSNLEHGGSSPTLATLRKILKALDTDLKTFFSNTSEEVQKEGFIFRRENMRMAVDGARRYTFILPHREDIKVEPLDEYIMPSKLKPEFETLDCDITGIISTGTLELELEEGGRHMLRSGDAFYIPSGKKHRGRCLSLEPVHLITIYIPPKY